MRNYRYIPFKQLRRMYKRRLTIIEAVGTMAVALPSWCMMMYFLLFAVD